MICTEKEASEKWCPQARMLTIGESGGASFNRSPFEPDPASGVHCIGSACMMWEWAQGDDFGPHETSEHGLDSWLKDGWVETEDSMAGHRRVIFPPQNRRGTCGLINRSGS